MQDPIPESITELINRANPRTRGVAADATGPDPTFCATTRLYVKTQFAFYVAFQLLFYAIALAVAAALVIFIIRLTDGVDPTGLAGILGTMATGTAAGFLKKAANDARARYTEAMAALQASGC